MSNSPRSASSSFTRSCAISSVRSGVTFALLTSLAVGCVASDPDDDDPMGGDDNATTGADAGDDSVEPTADGGTGMDDGADGADDGTDDGSDDGPDPTGGDDGPVEPPVVPDCPNILTDLIDRHGEAQGIEYYQRRFGTDNATPDEPEPTEAPQSGHFTSPLSGLEFWQLAEQTTTTGASERNHTFFNVDGSAALVRTRSNNYAELILVTDLDRLPHEAPTFRTLALDENDPNVTDWGDESSTRFWHPTDPDRFCWFGGQTLSCYDVVAEQSEVHTEFARGPVTVIRDGSDLAGGRFFVYLPSEDAGFVYDIAADTVITTDQEPGPNFGSEIETPVDGMTDEPVFTVVKGPNDVDYIHLTEDGRFTVWINKDGGDTELRDLSGTMIGIVSEDKNHTESSWYRDEDGEYHYFSLHLTGSSNTKPGTVFEGWDKRLWAGVIFDAEPQPDGTWTFERRPILVGDTSYGGEDTEYNDTVVTQFSAYQDNPYVMAGSGWTAGQLRPTYGVYSIMPRLDALSGENLHDIDRIAYARIVETHVGTQAEPVIGPMGEDGSYVAMVRIPWYGGNDGDNTIYATRIYPRLRPEWHETVMEQGQLPSDWCD